LGPQDLWPWGPKGPARPVQPVPGLGSCVPFRPFRGPFRALLEPGLGGPPAPLGPCPLGALWALKGPLWGLFWACLGASGPSARCVQPVAVSGPFGALKGPILAPVFGPFSGPFGPLKGAPFRALKGRARCVQPVAILGPLWAPGGASGAPPLWGLFWGGFPPVFGLFWAPGGPGVWALGPLMSVLAGVWGPPGPALWASVWALFWGGFGGFWRPSRGPSGPKGARRMLVLPCFWGCLVLPVFGWFLGVFRPFLGGFWPVFGARAFFPAPGPRSGPGPGPFWSGFWVFFRPFRPLFGLFLGCFWAGFGPPAQNHSLFNGGLGGLGPSGGGPCGP